MMIGMARSSKSIPFSAARRPTTSRRGQESCGQSVPVSECEGESGWNVNRVGKNDHFLAGNAKSLRQIVRHGLGLADDAVGVRTKIPVAASAYIARRLRPTMPSYSGGSEFEFDAAVTA